MADKLDMVRNMVLADPNAADLTANFFLRANMDQVKYEEMVGKRGAEERAQELQPSAVRKSEADATTAEAKAKYAEPQILADMQEQGWKIEGIKADIGYKRAQTQIAAMNAALGRENNDLKRQELQVKINEVVSKQESAIREKTAEIESARTNMDNMLNTADRILNTPISVIGAAAGPVSSRIPTTRQSTADFESLIETLQSQSFLAQIPNIKGMGALSNAEGAKLEAALQSFSLKQSPERLIENVKEAQRLIKKGRANLAARYGVPESEPDRPAAQQNSSDILRQADEILRGGR
jgi:hypothetical protein